MDKISKQQRSKIMSKIHSKWTKQEILVHRILIRSKIEHQMHPKISGSPDILLNNKKIAIFLHGCFWHVCPKHYRAPKSNKKYWTTKAKRNVARDRSNVAELRHAGYRVIVIWEHDIRDSRKLVKKLNALTANIK